MIIANLAINSRDLVHKGFVAVEVVVMGDDGTPNTTENQTQEMPPLPMHNRWKQAGSLWKLELGGY